MAPAIPGQAPTVSTAEIGLPELESSWDQALMCPQWNRYVAVTGGTGL
jgi:hypothetical protein